ncbi:uncharacterized protein PGTG_13267 [Puccinia graminis f. sp. tritici CRL 75-36-700-3]|uniref:Uncharacterized protein n=1 Tax=Puccinia graminis f. sp. tritici (strain CRL 75-36-700-3 / race SCCL) TaxID=418459 RepID=E3KRX3_PUCGT|nr:uncharacterized protein PGTG_13267 [Puccinia graminis f. sp. tritici CRL 75-36-700-3]EFP87048.2 hypothetical protein PGTG_13267 [Puccinia graminis f. sp. tritici CRL 75-36-700-3]
MKSFIFVTSLWMISLIASTGGSLATGPSSASRGKGVMDTEKNTVEWESEERYYMRDAKALAAWDLGVTAELLARSGKGAKALHKIDTGGVSGLFQFFTKGTGSLMLSSGKHDIVYTLEHLQWSGGQLAFVPQAATSFHRGCGSLPVMDWQFTHQ